MSWNSIIGQERIKTILKRSFLSGKIAHAYLFYGPEGVGKDAAAIEFAKLLNCATPADGEACDRCTSCMRVKTLQHPNLKLIVPLPLGKSEKESDDPFKGLDESTLRDYRKAVEEKAADPYKKIMLPRANTIKINSIRDIRKSLILTPADGGKMVIIISEAHMMKDPASNSLLKTLEEPAAGTVLILTTPYHDRLLDTIVSRCQAVRFEILRESEIQEALLQRNPDLDEREADMISRMANGNLLRAQELLTADLVTQREEMLDLLRLIVARPPSVWVPAIEQMLASNDRPSVERSLMLLNLWLRDAMMIKEGNDDAVINLDHREPLGKFINHFTRADLTGVIGAVERAIALVRKNVYLSLIIMNLAFELRELIVKR
jgi:DNA polymerase III subunit delta'